jgi:glycosyltransferase involved in cell wall biosynthesis
MADVFVMPMRKAEMFGMPAVEAQACRIPVIARDHGGLRETVPRSCGGRFPLGDARSPRRSIGCSPTPGARSAAGGEAVKNARRYAWDRIAQGLDEAYKGGSSAAFVGPLRLVRAAEGTGRRGPAWRAR